MDSKFCTEKKNLNDPLLEFVRVPHRVTLFPEHFSRYSIFPFLSHFFPPLLLFSPLFISNRTAIEYINTKRNKNKNKMISDYIKSNLFVSQSNNYQKNWRIYIGFLLIASKNKPISNKEPRFLDISNIILGQLNGYAINCANRFLERVLSTYHMRKSVFKVYNTSHACKYEKKKKNYEPSKV